MSKRLSLYDLCFRCNFCHESFVSATWMGIHRRKMHPEQWQEEVKRRKEKAVLKRNHNNTAEQLEEAQNNPGPTNDTSQANINSKSEHHFGFMHDVQPYPMQHP